MFVDDVKGIIEGLLFVAGEQGVTLNQLVEVLEFDLETIKEIIDDMQAEYLEGKRGIQIVELAGAYQLTTKKEHAIYFQKLVETPGHTGLSQAALETLAIIAYKQPITRVEIEEIRGVKTEKALQTLIAKLVVKEVGRAEGTGRAILYGTTKEFLDYFGLRSLEDLPPIPEDLEHDNMEEEADLFFKKFEEGIDDSLLEQITKESTEK